MNELSKSIITKNKDIIADYNQTQNSDWWIIWDGHGLIPVSSDISLNYHWHDRWYIKDQSRNYKIMKSKMIKLKNKTLLIY
jgi:hypothetical protein